jgi:hypothetical protein
VLFIGTQFSNLYTAVDTPAEAACVENTLVRGGVGTCFSNLYTAVDTPAGFFFFN